MVTTTRRSTEVSSAYQPANGGVGLLERPVNYGEYASTSPAVSEISEQELEEQKAKRQNNLQKLMNYDRYSEQVAVEVETEKASLADEDIRPTSTTMQFGDDIDIRKEMNRAQDKNEDGYYLNKKGKLVVTLYALVVTVILALIVMNTGVLASLSAKTDAKSAELSATVAKYEAIQSEIDAMTSPDYVIDVAQNQYGMIKQ
ncbi:MAG: hypothetical protein E7347_01315 [Clostridiales bacterium]|nr:hypothetical protein [Clostridiales bacterium]